MRRLETYQPEEPVTSAVREPKAYPAAPPRLPGAPRPRFTLIDTEDPPAVLPVVETVEPAVQPPQPEAATGAVLPEVAPPDGLLAIYPRLRRPPVRSRLSPAQRAQRPRADSPHGTGAAPYVTYIVEVVGSGTNSQSQSPEKPPLPE